MQEQTVNLREYLQNGLRPELLMPKNSRVLSVCTNAMPSDRGLLSPTRIQTPFASDPFDDWPWPQILRGGFWTLLGGKTTLQIVTEGTTWNRATANLYQLETPGSAFTLTAGGVWHFADFGKTWVASNGVSLLTLDTRYSDVGGADKVLGTTAVPIKALCAFNGRALYGGFSASFAWPTAWSTMLTTYLSGSSYVYSTLDFGENFVCWTAIGKQHLPLHDPPSDLIGMIRQGQFGFAPMPWKGTVYALKQLGNDVIAYGSTGIARLTPHGVNFGIQKLASFGIASRGAVGGDEDEHIFINDEGALWRLSGQGLQRLGFEELLFPMVGQEIAISLDPARREYYICGEGSTSAQKSFILSPQGLGGGYHQVTSCVRSAGFLYGVYAAAASAEVAFTTEVLDFGSRDFKTLTGVEIEHSTSSTVAVAISTRNTANGSWTTSTYRNCDANGYVRVQKTAVDFRIHVTVASHSSLQMSNLRARVQFVGRRFRRGVDADSTDA